MNIIMQANVMSYLDIVIPVVMFDFIDSNEYISNAFEALYAEEEKKNIREQVQDLGYDTHIAFLNMKTMSLL
jgi:hypothetical protein